MRGGDEHLLERGDGHLLTDELSHRLLRWLSEPDAARRAMSAEEWARFRDACRGRFGVDPETHGRLTLAQRLGSRQGGMVRAWACYEADPERYPNIPELLERADPAERDPADDESAWPLLNRRQEDVLRRELANLGGKSAEEAAALLRELEREHGERRSWVWARLGRSPLASVLPHLLRIADEVTGGGDPDKIDEASRAALALAAGNEGDQMAVAVVLRSLGAPVHGDQSKLP